MNMRGFGSVQKSCQWPPSVGHFFRSEMFTRELCYGLVKEIGVGLLELGKQVGIELGKVKRFGFGEEVWRYVGHASKIGLLEIRAGERSILQRSSLQIGLEKLRFPKIREVQLGLGQIAASHFAPRQ